MVHKKRFRNYDEYDDLFDDDDTDQDFGLFEAMFKPVIDAIKPQVKGFIGEFTVSMFLEMLDKSKYKVINDVILITGNRTAQIDHIIVSNYGVFVVETKNYGGIIYGDDKNPYWTQVLHNRKESMYNPVKQNNSHIKSLREKISDLPEAPIHSIIVFHPDAELRVSTNTHVGYPMDLLDTIKSYTNTVISDTLKEQIYARLCWFKIENKDLVHKHTENVKKNIDEQEMKLENGICPRCGGKLLLRNGQFGSFKGCSNFPECRFTAKI